MRIECRHLFRRMDYNTHAEAPPPRASQIAGIKGLSTTRGHAQRWAVSVPERRRSQSQFGWLTYAHEAGDDLS